MACARAAALLSLSVRQVRRLKKRLREQGEAALAHANRGQPSPRRLPSRVRQAVIRLARTTYAGFNDHHLCEKLCEVEGFSLSRETLRRLLRQAGLGSPRKRRAPAHRQRRLRSAREGELVQLDGSPHDWLEGRGPRLTALGLQDDATGNILAAQFFPSESALGYLALVGPLSPVMLVAWFAVFGFVSAFGPVLIAHGKALFSLHQVGRGLTVLNMGSMGGVFLSQAVSGFVIEWFPVAADGAYSLSAYRAVFGLQAIFILLVSLVYFQARDPMQKPRE